MCLPISAEVLSEGRFPTPDRLNALQQFARSSLPEGRKSHVRLGVPLHALARFLFPVHVARRCTGNSGFPFRNAGRFALRISSLRTDIRSAKCRGRRVPRCQTRGGFGDRQNSVAFLVVLYNWASFIRVPLVPVGQGSRLREKRMGIFRPDVPPSDSIC